jgi:hypothetical protein
MKKTFTTASVLALLLVLSTAAGAQSKGGAPATVKQLTLTFELNDLPGCNSPGSFWQVAYEWRIADSRDFDRWSQAGEDPDKESTVGALLSKRSFRRKNLSSSKNRRFIASVPVKGELLERLRNAGRREQIVWLDAVVRVHDGQLGTDVVKKVNPAWGPYFYREGNAVVRMEVTDEGRLQWYTGTTPPWAEGGNRGLRISRTRSPK